MVSEDSLSGVEDGCTPVNITSSSQGDSCKITVTAVHFVTVRIVLIYFRLHIRDSESNYITCHLSVSGWLQLKSAVSSNGC